MNIIVIGAGKVGETLVKNFVREGHNLAVIDVNPVVVNKMVNNYDTIGIIGSGIEREIMIESGVNKCDIFIACTSRDEVNVLTCGLAKKLGAKKTIARVRDPQLFKEINGMKDVLGLDMAFNPELRTAVEIAKILKFPSAKNVDSFASGSALMFEFAILENNPLVGKSIAEVSKSRSKVLFATVQRNDEVIIPRGDFVFEAGDEIYIIASEEDLVGFCKENKLFKKRAKSVFIIGGGKVAYYLAKELIASDIDVKIMEMDKDKCAFLSEELYGATVLCADATDKNNLEQENFKGSDACVLLTGLDETNIVLSLYAKQKNVDKIVTKIDRESFLGMVKPIGLDVVLSPKNVISNHIIKFVRANMTDSVSSIKNLYRIGEKAEALEFMVSDDFTQKGVALKELKLKSNILIGGIVRNGEFILPSGDTYLDTGDRVIVISKSKSINNLSEIFR